MNSKIKWQKVCFKKPIKWASFRKIKVLITRNS